MHYKYYPSRVAVGYKPRRRQKLWLLIVTVLLVCVAAIAAAVLVRHFSGTADIHGYTAKSTPGTTTAVVGEAATHAYGIAAGSSLTALSDAELNHRLDGMAALGVTWIRYDFDWSLIQPNNAKSYDWSRYDKLVAASKKRNLKVLGIITYTPGWARAAACRDTSKCYPADSGQFAAFAAAVAARYKSSGLHYWEIWNEPNNPDFWAPRSDPARYTQLLQQTSAAIHKKDASAYLLTGGLSPQETNSKSYTPVDFLTAVYKAGGKPYFNGVAHHPYTFPLSPKDSAPHAWNQMAASTNSLRQVMTANGDGGKKVWITEFGAPTGGPGPVSTIQNPNLSNHPYVVDEQLQAKLLTDALDLYASYDWAGPFFWYSYQDAGTSPSTNENFFGLVRYNGTAKPAYDAYRQAISPQ